MTFTIGTFAKIGGVDCYVATPVGEYPKDKVLLYLPDALGMQSPNSQVGNGFGGTRPCSVLTGLATPRPSAHTCPQLLADDFARNGWKTVLVDYFEGEPVPSEEVFRPGGAATFDIPAWLAWHPPPQVADIVRRVMAALKAEGVTRFASTGYCYGGRTGIDLGLTNELAVVTTAHPSLISDPRAELEVGVVELRAMCRRHR